MDVLFYSADFKDILPIVLSYLNRETLFQLARLSHFTFDLVHRHYLKSGQIIADVAFSIEYFSAYCNITIKLPPGTRRNDKVKISLSRKKCKRFKANNLIRYTIWHLYRKEAIMPTFNPILDNILVQVHLN